MPAPHDLQRSDSLLPETRGQGQTLRSASGQVQTPPSPNPVVLSRSCGSWLGRCMALAADAAARGNSEASEGSALYSSLAFCYPSIADPEDAETEGLPWQPDFIGDRSRSRHLALNSGRQASVSPILYCLASLFPSLLVWPHVPAPPLWPGSLSPSAPACRNRCTKGWGREWGADEGSSTRTGCLRPAATNPERTRPPAREDAGQPRASGRSRRQSREPGERDSSAPRRPAPLAGDCPARPCLRGRPSSRCCWRRSLCSSCAPGSAPSERGPRSGTKRSRRW